jgi:CBS-domain-containing membrane protein
MNADKVLHELRAADLMSRELLLIPEDMPLRDAARTLVRHHVSGAPVVDYRRVLVGVISSSDFVREMTHEGGAPSDNGHADCVYSEWQVVEVDKLTTEAVRHCMTSDPVTAEEDTPIADLARMMIDAHIHRVIIVDADHSPRGIVTTTDILAAVARLAIEPEFAAEGATLAHN